MKCGVQVGVILDSESLENFLRVTGPMASPRGLAMRLHESLGESKLSVVVFFLMYLAVLCLSCSMWDLVP